MIPLSHVTCIDFDLNHKRIRSLMLWLGGASWQLLQESQIEPQLRVVERVERGANRQAKRPDR